MKRIEIKKNILDLEFQKNLIVSSTALIILITYIIGAFIAILSNDLNIQNKRVYIPLVMFTVITFSSCTLFFSISLNKMKQTLKKIEMLDN